MITPADTKWGSYQQYEGAWYPGKTKFKLPDNPTPADLVMNVITSTEGGAADAINAYDRCMISLGFFQWCEIYRLSSKLLAAVQKKDPDLLAPLQPALDASGVDFRGDFFWKGQLKPIRQRTDQQRLFLLNSNGQKGTWDRASKEHVKLWVASASNVLSQPEAVEAQVAWTVPRVRTFATKEARGILFDSTPDTGWPGALRAAFLSFAANNPAYASKHLQKAVRASVAKKWSSDWCISVLKELTFGPKITIYPHRYDKIRPVIEQLYGVNLPDFAKELKDWQAQHDTESQAETGEPQFLTTAEIQQQLVDMGYDLGSSGPNGDGVDDVMGRKTREAIYTFQERNGLKKDEAVGPKTRAKLLEAWRARICT
jgi:hypothetical protein